MTPASDSAVFSHIAPLLSQLGIAGATSLGWVIIGLGFGFVALYSLVLAYHWLRYGGSNVLVIVAAAVYGTGQILLVSIALSAVSAL